MPGAGGAARAVPALDDSIFNDMHSWAVRAPHELDAFYNSPFAVHSIFRSLPPLARIYVMRLLYVPANDPSVVSIQSFSASLRRRQRALDRNDSAFGALNAFGVIVNNSNGSVSLNPRFADRIRSVLAGEMPLPFGGPIAHHPETSRAPDANALQRFSAKQLERILNYLVESNGSDTPSDSVLKALVDVGILGEQNNSNLCISSAGFQFLLKDAFSQVWILLRSVISNQYKTHEFQTLNFTFQLSFAKVGALYVANDLGDAQRNLLTSLDALGVIQLEENNMFRPTLVGKSLLTAASRITSGASKLVRNMSSTGDVSIVVETNFRVYAYTKSVFQMNLLGLFTQLRYRLPNLVVCHLTREAVRQALQNGISASQIIAYLNAHADSRMKEGVVPSNVSHEIRLWEGEQERVREQPGVMINVETPGDLQEVEQIALNANALLFINHEKQFVIVSAEKYEIIRKLIRTMGN